MVSEIKKIISPIRNYGEEEEGMDNIDIGGDLEEEKNPFYEEDENGEEFLQ